MLTMVLNCSTRSGKELDDLGGGSLLRLQLAP